MSDHDHISPLGAPNGKLPEDKLLAYLEGRLSPEEQHEVELWLAEEGMESDAVEGLTMIEPSEARHTVGRLNHKLRKEIGAKKRRRKALKTDQLTYIAIGIILLLAIAAFILVRMKLHQ